VADVQGKFIELVKQLVDEKHATVDFEEPITKWRRAHLGEIDDPRMVSFFKRGLNSHTDVITRPRLSLAFQLLRFTSWLDEATC
jgi:hypothetical protein